MPWSMRKNYPFVELKTSERGYTITGIIPTVTSIVKLTARDSADKGGETKEVVANGMIIIIPL